MAAKLIKCLHCDASYRSKFCICLHERLHQDPLGTSTSYQCFVCKKEFTKFGRYQSHLQYHGYFTFAKLPASAKDENQGRSEKRLPTYVYIEHLQWISLIFALHCFSEAMKLEVIFPVTRCMIKTFSRGRGSDSFCIPFPPFEQFLPFPPSVSRCFWKDSLMTPHPLLSHFKHLSPPPPFKHLSLFRINGIRSNFSCHLMYDQNSY